MSKIKSFTDLVSWQHSHRLAVDVYEISRKFPEKDKFGLTSQVRRSSLSVTSNLAEGFGRRSSKEKTQFYYLAAGSLTELQNQLLLARDVGIIDDETFRQLANQSIEALKLIHGLIRSNKERRV
ncbi:four helix bundle protein [Candidatus Saccharibacteria bacterium CPR2]|nr:four helix bundle protein [Candidatus Saccharibacteria bacterium CPR2]